MSTDKKKIFKFFFGGGGRNPLLGGLHLTLDAHFRTRVSYSSQKSFLKICFGLVEIGGTVCKISGRQQKSPIMGGSHVNCDTLSYMAKLFQLKFLCENLIRIG